MAGAGAVALLLSAHLPAVPLANRLVLAPPEDGEGDSPLPGAGTAASLLGQVGTTATMLGLAGTARFGGRRVDVVTEGALIPAGTAVQVVEVEGTRVVVRPV
jgi:membrane-bound serine protease (ClpP class)